MMQAALHCGDARTVVDRLTAASIHCCVTSPPYFGLRSYNAGHAEIGAESTPAEYVAALAEVFRAVWRVLRADGTLWVVLGDSYAAGGLGAAPSHKSTLQRHGANGRSPYLDRLGAGQARRAPSGVPGKSLLGIPWRVAFALQDDGWILRQELIWAKSNAMPESVKDRCTRAHETVFMLTKQARYYFDAAAIAEPSSGHAPGTGGVGPWKKLPGETTNGRGASPLHNRPARRNKRSVWTVATAPLSSKKYGVQTDHYAAFPPELVRPMIRAGCPPDGTVLDPFCGSGTTGLVAAQEGRRFIGCDVNAQYVDLAHARISTAQPPLVATRDAAWEGA